MPTFNLKLSGPRTVPRAESLTERVAGVASVEILSSIPGSGYGSLCRDRTVISLSCSEEALPLVEDYLLFNRISCEVEEAASTADEATSVPVSVLDLSVPKLRMALATGDYDMYLEALLEAEQAGKTRTTAVEAIQERIGD